MGPLARVRLCLRRIGWDAISLVNWTDHYSQHIWIQEISPAMLDEKMQRSMMRANEFAAADMYGKEFDDRLCTDQIRAMCRSKRFSPWEVCL